VIPVHPNPAVMEPARRLLAGHPRIHLVEPLPYPDLVAALAGACGVLTDSGGIQEEAPTFGTPILVLREVSERPEVIEAGLAQLVGTDPMRILNGARNLLRRPTEDRATARRSNPYGDGKAAERIAALVEEFLANRGRSLAV
jgi:UDP-N-acetylglucosamine 2-epimerase (non-hydrolysing)